MVEQERPVDWTKTSFDGSRREQLRRAQAMNVRQRLEAMDELARLSERLRAMPKQAPVPGGPPAVRDVGTAYRIGPSPNEIVLDGCTPTPLANYLKALGVLRLLSAQYPETRGFWRGDRFVLRTSLDREGIERFFLDEYEPTPIMAPWNGGSGFFFRERTSNEKDPATSKKKKLGIRDQPTAATKIVDAILASTSKRLEPYRNNLDISRKIVKQYGFVEAPTPGRPKDTLIISLRAELHDNSLEWIDAALSITDSGTKFPTLLGTGGNDGNMDYTSNFMQRIVDVIGANDDKLPDDSPKLLRISLFALPAPDLQQIKIGQFSPGRIGGKNASPGFEAGPISNSWDLVLTLEGALLFASAAVRRHADDPYNTMSFPFTVSAIGAGSGALGASDSDARDARGEMWMPIWSQPATYLEVRALMSEGRVAFGKKPARDALDFVRAVHSLGGYRGIRHYQRFGRLQRNGDNHLFTSLSRVEVAAQPVDDWLNDLDGNQWQERFRRFASDKTAPNSSRILRKRLEDALFAQSGREPSKAEAQALLMLLGEIQAALSSSHKVWESVPPVPRLSESWLAAADDNTPAFRIAKALAGLRGVGDELLPLRAQLFPVERKRDRWMTPDSDESVRIHTGQRGRLTNTLRALLERRLWLAEKLEMEDKPLFSSAGATLEDVAAFLRDDSMDARIAALLPGLCLCDIPQDTEHSGGEGSLPAAFGLLKLALTPDRTLRCLGRLGEQEHLPLPTGMLAQLAAGNHDNRGVQAAWRRLRASGLAPAFAANALPNLRGIEPLRATAALLIPLRYSATRALARSVLQTLESETDAA